MLRFPYFFLVGNHRHLSVISLYIDIYKLHFFHFTSFFICYLHFVLKKKYGHFRRYLLHSYWGCMSSIRRRSQKVSNRVWNLKQFTHLPTQIKNNISYLSIWSWSLYYTIFDRLFVILIDLNQKSCNLEKLTLTIDFIKQMHCLLVMIHCDSPSKSIHKRFKTIGKGVS